MNKIYKGSERENAVSRLLKLSAVAIMVMVWILIDKGNVYGQSLSQGSEVKEVKASQTSPSAQLRLGDGGGRDGGLPADEGGNEFVTKPNPVVSDLVFDFEFTVKAGIPYQVLDPLGRLVAHGTFVPGVSTQSIDFSRFKEGMYLVRLQIGDKVAVRKILKR